ncbi:MAG: hypothetical protein EBY30_11445 [Rhodospirillales bacterium]|jgi:hypothetical protein|nr:hypothetical protein [Rhodospirillales bacterium]
MRPTSLLARLLAATPRGRRLFDLLASQEAELQRLRAELAAREPEPSPVIPEPPEAALLALLAAAEFETNYNRDRLRDARARPG